MNFNYCKIIFICFSSFAFFIYSFEFTSKEYKSNFYKEINWEITTYLDNNTKNNCTNCIPEIIKLSSKNEIFCNFPRRKDFSEMTFGKFNKEMDSFDPWPSVLENECNNTDECNGLISIVAFEIDPNDNIYLIDNGQVSNETISQPKLFKYSINGDIIDEYILEDNEDNQTIILNSTDFNDLVFDKKYNYVYISFSGIHNGLLVVNLDKKEKIKTILYDDNSVEPDKTFWLHINDRPIYNNNENDSTPLKIGINGLALSCDSKTLFYCPLSSRMIYSIPVDEIRNSKNIKIKPNYGHIKEATSGLIASNKGNLFLLGIETGSLYIANQIENDLARLDEKNFFRIFPEDFAIWPYKITINNGRGYFLSNRKYYLYEDYEQNITNSSEIIDDSYSIVSFDIDNDDSYIKVCSGFDYNWGIASYVIWITFAIVIFIVLVFVYISRETQDEVESDKIKDKKFN